MFSIWRRNVIPDQKWLPNDFVMFMVKFELFELNNVVEEHFDTEYKLFLRICLCVTGTNIISRQQASAQRWIVGLLGTI